MATTDAPVLDRDMLAFELERFQDDLSRLVDRIQKGHFPRSRDRLIAEGVEELVAAARGWLNRCEGMATGDIEPLSTAERDLVYVTNLAITGHSGDADAVNIKNAIRLICE
jgi:hypothetical protein